MSTFPSSPETLSIPEALARAHAHWEAGQADQAEHYCQRVLAVWPGQTDALHLLGLMAHAYGNLDVAIAHIRQACMAPRVPAVYWSNLAEMYRQKARLSEAEEAARRAVAIDPALAVGWNNLGIVLQEAGKLQESLAGLERVITLRPDWAEAHNNLANTARRLGRMDFAEQHYRQALTLNPNYAEAHCNLAFLLSTQGRYDEAASRAQCAIDINPRMIEAYVNLADVEVCRGRHDAALRTLDMLVVFAPRHPTALLARAKVLRQLDRLDDALAIATEAVSVAPQTADAHYVLALVCQALGRADEALVHFEQAAQLPGTVTEQALIGRAGLLLEDGREPEALIAFDQALKAFPESVPARASRAVIRRFEAGDPDIAALEAAVAQNGYRPLAEQIAAHFSLGKAYLDIGDPEQAFRHFEEGNRQKRATFSYDASLTGQWMERVAEAFSPARYERLHGAGEPSELPIFIIGMPCSGTALVHRVLRSHPRVARTGELSALRLAVEGAGVFPDWVCALDDAGAQAVLRQCGQAYLTRVSPLAQGRAHLIDKAPGNFLYAGLIPLILPGARIVHVRRDPVNTCLACYTELVDGPYPFAYDQTELGLFYRHYERLMAHWRAILPREHLIETDYEAVIGNLEGEARRLIDFLDLPWNDACLSWREQSRGMARIANANQIEQPPRKSPQSRWHAYAPYLGPLLEALEIAAP